MENLLNVLDKIRYSIVRFRLELSEDTQLVKYKSSAIRGGIGEMLLRNNCISDRNCEQCGFAEACLVQNIMYSRIDNKPDYMNVGDSVGYIVECADNRCNFHAGDILEFRLYLFGTNIVYFGQYINAIYALGMHGLGTNKSRYSIRSIYNMYGEDILEGEDIHISGYRYQTIGSYVNYRMKLVDNHNIKLCFLTPCTVKYQGEFIKNYIPEAIVNALYRRVNILAAFEKCYDESNLTTGYCNLPHAEKQEFGDKIIPRFSSRKNSHINLKGMVGWASFSYIDMEGLVLLLAGEILHIGKNTSFGFGKIKVDNLKEGS